MKNILIAIRSIFKKGRHNPIHEFWRLDLYDDRHQDEILRSLYHSG